jgi:DNA-binding Lrp family transcriptional regulator
MSDEVTELIERVFARVVVSFPVSESPYCDLAEELGASEIDVLTAMLELRECGRVSRVAAELENLERFVAMAAADDVDLAILSSTDLPTGEHPYAELAAQLQLRGVDRTAEWVLSRLKAWLAEGTVIRVAAQAG